MKKAIFLFYILVMTCCTTSVATAQEKQKARIGLIRQNGNTVTLTVTSSTEFYMGGNKHMLYIGTKKYDLYDQNNIDGHGMLKFFLPTADYKAMKNGTPVYLSYGELEVDNEQQLAEMSKDADTKCWYLGKLNKKVQK